MDVRERIEPGAAPRCPYCHDLLAGEQPDALVTCGGCGTRHHAACVDELGRCTVLGCGWISPTAVELPHLEDTRTVEDLRRVIQLRARRYLDGRSIARRHREQVLPRERWFPSPLVAVALTLLVLLVVPAILLARVLARIM